jgi:hypothetical protein
MIPLWNRAISKEDLISYKESELSQFEKVVFFARKKRVELERDICQILGISVFLKN